MKWLRNILDKQRPKFEQGGALYRLRALFEATDTFFFATEATTKQFPHVRDPLDVKRYMSLVIVALIPSVLCALYFFGIRVLLMIIVSYAVGGLIEVFFAIVRKEEINEGFLVTGLIFPLTLPPALPLWMVGVGSAIAVIVGKELFGGTGRNLFNPALVGRCFLALSYPEAISARFIEPGSGLTGRLTEWVAADAQAVTSATPLVMGKQDVFTPISGLLTGSVAGSAGETSAIAIILGGIFLLVIGIINWRTVVSSFGTFAVAGLVLHHLYPASFGPMGWHLFAGGLLFGFFFMATDPVTGPVSNSAKWVYGALIGLVTLLIRNLTGYVEGVMFAVLLGNIVAPILDEIAVRTKLLRLQYESYLYTLIYAVTLGSTCALLLAAVGRVTAPFRETNAKADEVRNILGVLNIQYPQGASADDLLTVFNQNVETISRGDLNLYRVQESGAVAVNFSGPGLWGPIEGFLALEADMRTIRGITFHKQEETPGLGGEIASQWFREQFAGKSIVSATGEPGIAVVSGKADGQNQVQAITGATMTGNKVEEMLDKVAKKLIDEVDNG